MIRRLWRVLPGPMWVRVLEAAVVTAAFLVALHFFYDWLGKILLDQGGTVG